MARRGKGRQAVFPVSPVSVRAPWPPLNSLWSFLSPFLSLLKRRSSPPPSSQTANSRHPPPFHLSRHSSQDRFTRAMPHSSCHPHHHFSLLPPPSLPSRPSLARPYRPRLPFHFTLSFARPSHGPLPLHSLVFPPPHNINITELENGEMEWNALREHPHVCCEDGMTHSPGKKGAKRKRRNGQGILQLLNTPQS